ncbi:DUF108 domain-containing protein [Variovorax sp. J22P271]|uniref:aspartate dehydrogenase domain-containing protein n=1 Tax=Variovorax davisae TaxID=3053515 RepID=UPI002578410F|nr:aspartate dehydrogenase domain-containing protein [Variovorax sp. J22P271]MDM0034265.1 DUF108 domain-containing protein [Variovorax sp. J22P271]
MPESKSLPERRLGLIGFGRIASPVIDCWNEGGLPGWKLAGVLARGARQRGAVRSTDDAEDFFRRPFDLIIEAAGPPALAALGERALAVADVWTVSAAALADATLFDALQAAGLRAGHRLRVMPGAIAGLDGVAMASVDPAAELQLDIDLVPGPGPRALVFSGSVREAALRFPDSVNVAAAAALAGPGLDKARIHVYHPGPVPRHRLALRATSRFGLVQASVEPLRGPGVHPVSACLIAALRAELRAIWSG